MTHQYKPTKLTSPQAVPACTPNRPDHEFVFIGLMGIPKEGNPDRVVFSNRYFCSRCLLQVWVEESEVSRHDAGDQVKLPVGPSQVM